MSGEPTSVGRSLRRVEVAQELETIAGRARDAAQERYQTGAAPRLEALQSQLALAQAQNDSTAAHGDADRGPRGVERAPRLSPDAARARRSAGGRTAADAGRGRRQALDGQHGAAVLKSGSTKAARASRWRTRCVIPIPTVTGDVGLRFGREFTSAGARGPRSRCRSSPPAAPTSRSRRRDLERARRPRRPRGADHRRGGAAVSRAHRPRQAVLRYQNEILPAFVQVEQMADESYRAGQTGLPAYLQTVQAAREDPAHALQAAWTISSPSRTWSARWERR